MIWMQASKFQCEDEISTWQGDYIETWKNDENNIPAFSPKCEMPNLSDAKKNAYLNFRHQLLEAETQANDKAKKEHLNDFQQKLAFGLSLYSILENEPYKISLPDAANDNVWRYLSVFLVPDILYRSYNNNVPDTHLYRRKWRIFLKTFWWLIYLAGIPGNDGKLDKERTWEILSVHQNDLKDSLLDRSGSGFRRDFIRVLVQKYTTWQKKNYQTFEQDAFRYLMKLYHITTQVIDPDLAGYDDFADELIEKVDKNYRKKGD